MQAAIGAHAHEHGRMQGLRINVEVWVPLATSTPRRDRLEEVFDYDVIRRGVGERLARGHVQLQETLVDELLAMLLAHPQVRAARVVAEKTDIHPDCESVGCEVFALKPRG